jgi:hypothetical protein
MKRLLGVIVTSLLALSACASFGSFNRTDIDGDGRISQTEAKGSEDLAAVFSSADGDKNGSLDGTEFQLAEQLIAGWKASQSESGGDHNGGESAHSH